ncbi:ABC transporter substrate-binding protein [Alteromonas oceanisediminis]|uniref:ABC transporter substrate-binding protein n=1 Tax=Alteromonas oceanisediminis TaxID=2836180 RepID=UPI001BDB2F17|nr:ABC transporter substrate-binding protein [Alteromonas oceanisediminis]MBT0585182.1 ABC transporter substrate-binding protein [Alteromonas oceanisediminis]
MKFLRWVIVAGTLFSCFVAASDNILRVGIDRDIASTEYTDKHDNANIMVLHQIYEGLVAYDENMELAPLLAKHWDVSDDGKTYRFTLRQDAMFHNGESLNAEIVKWNFERFLSVERDWGAHCRDQLNGGFEEYIRPAYIVDISVLSPFELEVRLQSPSGMFLHHLANEHCIYPIIHPDSLGKDGKWKSPIATGPFQLESWSKGKSIVLSKNEHYRGQAGMRNGLVGNKEVLLEKIEFFVQTSKTEALAKLSKGELDLVPDIDILTETDVINHQNTVLRKTTVPSFLQLIVQSRSNTILDKVEMRQAIAYALDKQKIIKESVGSFAKVNHSAVAKSSPYFSLVQQRGTEYDVEKSKHLLSKAGYAGEYIPILASKAPYPVFSRAAELVAEMLQAVGINSAVEYETWAEHRAKYAQNDYSLTLISFSVRTDPALMYSAMVGQKGDHAWYMWEDMEAESLVTRAVIERDSELRQALFDQLHQKMLDWTPTVGLSDFPRIDAVGKTVEGYEPWALGIPRLWGVKKHPQ